MSGTTPSPTTSRSGDATRVTTGQWGVGVVLECDRLAAGGGVASLLGIDRVVIGRGATRRVVELKKREIRIELPDRKASGDHAVLERKDGFILRDLGSTNGTFAGSERITEASIEPGEMFRVGHTFLSILDDAAPVAARGATLEPAAWPFPTLSGALRRDLDRLERVAPSPIPIVIRGDTGTGKEVLARAVHDRSGRPGAFVAVNCGALPPTLVESLLFGHKKGAFSGALRDEIGFVRQADAGTLFLDEIGDLPLPTQATLLRVLQEREVTPVGAFQPVRVEVRVLAATHRPLDTMVQSGSFRADLFSRLSGLVFRVPPLRDRKCDLGIIIARTLGDRAERLRLRPEAANLLFDYDYPHNIRELVQALEAALVLSEDGVVRPPDLPEAIRTPPEPARGGTAGSSRPPPKLSAEDQAIYEELVRRLAEHDGNITRVAKEMGKARQQVQRWMRRFGL